MNISQSSATLIEIVQHRAGESALSPLYTFLDGDGTRAALTLGELERRARAIATVLQRTFAAGDRVVLLYPPGLDYIAGFFGCLFGGVVAVPAYPPDPARLERTLPRLRAIAADAGAVGVLTTQAIRGMAEAMLPATGLRVLATDDLPAGEEAGWRAPSITGDSTAFLQYTSGSTGAPKGVILTHAVLLDNLRRISSAFDVRRGSKGVIWLPPYHDMGLIGGILQPLFAGIEALLMSPQTFIADPFKWLEAISSFGGTISGGPNFAFDLCARRIKPDQIARLDLSAWEVAFCGAEPIHAPTLRRFASAFAPAGFRADALYPCYGLAEATLLVSGGPKGRGAVLHSIPSAAGSAAFVGCGKAQESHHLAIVDPLTAAERWPGEVGEIWVSGPSVAGGYWNKPEETAAAFGARLAGSSRHYLRTGDLGALRADGELIVTGRLKDLIIVRGRNYYPQDIERCVEHCHAQLRTGLAAAFTVATESGDELALVAEVKAELAQSSEATAFEAIVSAIRQAVAREHELYVHTVVLASSCAGHPLRNFAESVAKLWV